MISTILYLVDILTRKKQQKSQHRGSTDRKANGKGQMSLNNKEYKNFKRI